MRYSILLALLCVTAAFCQDCHFNITQPSGTITHQSIGKAKCTQWIYHFLPQDESYQYVSLKFQNFYSLIGKMEVLAHDGPTTDNDIIMRWSDYNNLPFPVSSTQKDLTLHFSTSSADMYSWNFAYNFSTDKAPICSGIREISAMTGNISLSTTFGLDQTGALECRWLLNFPQTFNPASSYLVGQFDLLEFRDPLRTMTIRLYNGPSTRDTLFGIFSDDVKEVVSYNHLVSNQVLVRLSMQQFSEAPMSFGMQYKAKYVAVMIPETTQEESEPVHHQYLDTWAIVVISVGVALVVLFGLAALAKKSFNSFHRLHDDNVYNPESDSPMFTIN